MGIVIGGSYGSFEEISVFKDGIPQNSSLLWFKLLLFLNQRLFILFVSLKVVEFKKLYC